MRTPTPATLSTHPRWASQSFRLTWVWQLAGLLLVLVVLYLFIPIGTAVGRGGLLGVALLSAPLALLVWHRPLVGMVALIVVGSIHPFIMLLIYHFTGSTVLVKGAQLWKEIVVLVLLVKVIDLAFRRRAAPTLHLLDLGLVIYLAYGVAYLFYPSQLEESTFFSALMGLRADMFFLLAYFIGRGVTIGVPQVRALILALVITAFIIAGVGIMQFVFPGATNAFFEAISFREYMELQRGDQAVIYVIRQNDIAGVLIPRASSLLLSDLALAFYMLLVVPIAAALFITLPHLWQKLLTNVLLLATLGVTVLTMTRSAMIAMAPLLTTVLLRPAGIPIAVLVALQLAAVAIPVAYTLNVTPDLIWQVFSLKEASVQGHVEALEASLEIMREEPFGRGLGTAGQIAQRFTPHEGVTNESWYFQIATEMGIAAAVIWTLLLMGFCVVAFVQYWRVRDPWLKALCLGMAGATVGFAAVSATLHAWEVLTTSLMYWLFAGLVVRAHTIDDRCEEVPSAHRGLA